jgi:C4-dicarboxylate-specific signal transduction histidine kinase
LSSRPAIDSFTRRATSHALRYGLAGASVAAALGLARTFLYFDLPQPFAAFALSAIALTFWYGGTGPGILAALLSAIVRSSLFEAEIDTASRVAYDLVFLIFALLMARVTEARDQLEERIAERTAELIRANEVLKIEIADRKQAENVTWQALERLRQAQADLAHANRVTIMGELTASLAHEVNQPIAAALTNANTCLLWLARDTPDVGEARAATRRIVQDATRAGEIITRIRLLFKKGRPKLEQVDINDIIREIVALLRNEATRYGVSVRTELAGDLPPIMGDRVQLQQVMMNLIMNSIDAMKSVDGTREVAIASERAGTGQMMVSVSDTGVGLPSQHADRIFNAFVTTKVDGTGMGLSISRSIVEAHGGRLWAADNSPRGATFYLTLSANVEPL